MSYVVMHAARPRSRRLGTCIRRRRPTPALPGPCRTPTRCRRPTAGAEARSAPAAAARRSPCRSRRRRRCRRALARPQPPCGTPLPAPRHDGVRRSASRAVPFAPSAPTARCLFRAHSSPARTSGAEQPATQVPQAESAPLRGTPGYSRSPDRSRAGSPGRTPCDGPVPAPGRAVAATPCTPASALKTSARPPRARAAGAPWARARRASSAGVGRPCGRRERHLAPTAARRRRRRRRRHGELAAAIP
jgi:hypothetical protein